MARDNFIFHNHFYRAMKYLPEHEQIKLLHALCGYVFEDQKCNIDGIAASMFILMKAQIDNEYKDWDSSDWDDQADDVEIWHQIMLQDRY